MGYQKLLVMLDGSKFSERALKEVVRIAEPGAYIHLLSIKAENPVTEAVALSEATYSNTTPKIWPSIPPIADPLDPKARELYLQDVEDWLSQGEYHVTTEARSGEVIASILSDAQGDYDVMVMVTHGRTGMRKAILGSITEAVLRDAPCPVLVIPGSAK